MNKIVVVGQTPPPVGGQAVMISLLLEGKYANAELVHVRMAFSKKANQRGGFGFSKLLHLLKVIFSIVLARTFKGARVLYFPPSSGPRRFPVLRDMAILCCTRWMFRKTIFHFHAAGISEEYARLPGYLKWFFRRAYFKPDLAIQLSEHNPDDGRALGAGKVVFVPNGVQDFAGDFERASKVNERAWTILFVGLLTESKGVMVLAEAMKILSQQGIHARCVLVGEFASHEFEDSLKRRIAEDGLSESIEFAGVLTGRDKQQAYEEADIFCFPTFFESESFGLVVAEAMQHSLPVVASRWRGVQSLVIDGETGFLTPVNDSKAVAGRLAMLLGDARLRADMGAAGRRRFLAEYTVSKFYERMDEAFGLV